MRCALASRGGSVNNVGAHEPFDSLVLTARTPAMATLGVLLGLTVLAFAPAARGQAASSPASSPPAVIPALAPLKPLPARTYSSYEQETIVRALRRVGGRIDTAPEGKLIEAIHVVTFEVIEDRDPAPQFLNWFHVTTREYVVRREILLGERQPFVQRLSDETERNLRDLFLFSVVIAVPLQGSAPDRVQYLVITKDIWSLRAGWDGRFANGVVDYLSVRPTETNLFGTSRQLFATLAFTPRNYTVGVGFVEPRVAGTRLRIAASIDAIVSCQTGEIDGFSGSFLYTRPLFSTTTPWSYSTSVSATKTVSRLIASRGAAICSAEDTAETAVRFDDEGARTAIVPNEYTYDSQAFTQSFTRSFGWLYKTDLSFGIEALRTGRSAADLSNVRPGPSISGSPTLSAEELYRARLWYTSRIRPSSMQLSPFFQLSSYTTTYHRDLNAESLGLQEDFRMGPTAVLRVYPALESVGSSRDMLGLSARASYARPVGTGYVKVSGGHSVELSNIERTDAAVSFGARFTSPRLPYGRFVFDAYYVRRYHNYYNTYYTLDNATRLRGYTANALVNNDLFGTGIASYNLEFRTRPLQIFSTLLGGVLFHDVGDAFYELEDIKLKQSVGVGIRFLAPQLDRDVFRFDVGFPLENGDPQAGITVNAAFGQAFSPP
jgi:hypothetical protein